MLHVRLIGTLEVRCDGDVVAITPRAVGVLVRLALAGGPVRRDRLLMDVWGEDVDPGRRRSLETLISELRRKVVGKAGIVFRGDAYELRVPVTLDVARILSGERGVWSIGDELFVDRLGRSSWFERLEHQVDQMKAVLFDPSTASPDIQYANNDGRHIAYQDRDGRDPAVLLLAGLVTHCEMLWDAPGFRAWVEASFGDRRLIMLDKRGSGLSDPIDHVPTTQDFVDDIVSVLDVCEARQVVVVCAAEAGLFGPQLIAADPGRFSGAVFVNAIPKMFATDDYAPGLPEQSARVFGEGVRDEWGYRDVGVDLAAPSKLGNPEFIEWATGYQRAAATPGSVWNLAQYTAAADSRSHVRTLGVPSLVLQSERSRYFRTATATWLAEALGLKGPVWLDSADHLFWLADPTHASVAIGEFLAGLEASTG